MALSTQQALIGVAIMAIVTFITRAFPFLVFRKHKPGPRFLKFQKALPAAILGILVVYSMIDFFFAGKSSLILSLICLVVVAGLHKVWKNPLLSIFGGTILYMVLQAFFA
jgi:branched-subunit amino acid transport protein AzlD